MLSLMAAAYYGKGDMEKDDNFLQRINPYTSLVYHSPEILQELHMIKFELTKEIYEAVLYGYVHLEKIPEATKVVDENLSWENDLYGSLIEALAARDNLDYVLGKNGEVHLNRPMKNKRRAKRQWRATSTKKRKEVWRRSSLAHSLRFLGQSSAFFPGQIKDLRLLCYAT
ncbi:hypothetical protein Tco_0605390 [Tanacetum coccineum]